MYAFHAHFTPHQDLRPGERPGAVGILTGGSSGPQTFEGQPVGTDVKYDFDDDYFAAVSTSIKIKF